MKKRRTIGGMKKICAVSGREFEIMNDDLIFYEKMGAPVPTLCPEERQRRRISYRNFRSLYQRKCDATGKSLISMYHAEQPFPVYENEYWCSDKWDAKTYAREFDFSRPFFDQFSELGAGVPRFSTFNVQAENCRYSNFSWLAKNCYLVFGCVRDEDCMYGHIVWDSKNCVDNLYVYRCEWCSHCVDCSDSYDLHFSTECDNCHESYFLHDCRGCKNCFACTNLRQAQYCWLNEQLTRKEYEKRLAEVRPFTHETISSGKQWLEKLRTEQCVFPPMFGVKNENVTGNHLYECAHCTQCFDAKKSENSKFLYTAYAQENCYDFSFTGGHTKFCCDILTGHFTENSKYCHAVNHAYNLEYCEFCFHCHDCFGCSGLRNSQFCIFNKQYSEKEYHALREKLIEHMKKMGEWGEFFPLENSPFAYNEAIVNEYFPLTRDEVESRGWRWRDPEQHTKYDGPAIEIPATIDGVGDEICEKILTCAVTEKNYRIQLAELEFCRRMGLPLPRVCPDERHRQRMALRCSRQLHDRECGECGEKFQSVFSSDRSERVCCEKCYLSHVA